MTTSTWNREAIVTMMSLWKRRRLNHRSGKPLSRSRAPPKWTSRRRLPRRSHLLNQRKLQKNSSAFCFLNFCFNPHFFSRDSWAAKKAAQLAGPVAHGSKEVPDGAPDALAGLSFVFTGELSSFSREEATDLGKRFGGFVIFP